jgi:hypothetical protein
VRLIYRAHTLDPSAVHSLDIPVVANFFVSLGVLADSGVPSFMAATYFMGTFSIWHSINSRQ